MIPDFQLFHCDPRMASLDRPGWAGPGSHPSHVHKDREVSLSKGEERERETPTLQSGLNQALIQECWDWSDLLYHECDSCKKKFTLDLKENKTDGLKITPIHCSLTYKQTYYVGK